MGDGDHGWSAAEFINLIREMLVREHVNSVCLAEGVPDEWFGAEPGFGITCAPTDGGTISYRFEPRPYGARLNWSLERNSNQLQLPLYFLFPRTAGLRPSDAVESAGRAMTIQLKELEGSIDFEYVTKAQRLREPIRDATQL